MGTFAIHEDNMERLTSKLTRIQNKCKKYGKFFSFKEVGEEYRSVEDEFGNTIQARFVIIETEGIIQHNGWEFVAVVEHTAEGNVIRHMIDTLHAPTKYYTTAPICEHCNTIRNRKDTYLVHNVETDEWKQVGKSCLAEFTNGMDAEEVARYISFFDSVISGEAIEPGSYVTPYYNVSEIAQYAFETVKHFGYMRQDEHSSSDSTRSRCMDYFLIRTGRAQGFYSELLRSRNEEMDSANFNPESDECKQLATDAINWAKSQDDTDNEYLHNLKVICMLGMCSSRHLGILISLPVAYQHYLDNEAKKARMLAQAADPSTYVGDIGDKITLTPVSVECVSARDGMYGVQFLYKFKDADANVYMWSTSTYIDLDATISVTGKVKSHEEFRGVKQTWLTRCKVTEINESRAN